MYEYILPEAGAVCQTPQQIDELVVNRADTNFKDRRFARLFDFIIQLLSSFEHGLFNLCRMYSAIGNEFLNGKLGNLAADRIKTGNHQRFRRIINDNRSEER